MIKSLKIFRISILNKYILVEGVKRLLQQNTKNIQISSELA